MLMDDSSELHPNAAVSITCLRLGVGNNPSQGFEGLIDTQLYPQGYTSKSAAGCGVLISRARGCASQLWSFYALMIDGRHVRLRL
jgi:hypothetical protein